MQEFLTVKEMANVLKIPITSIRKCIREGRIKAFRVTSGKRSQYRISNLEILRLQALGTQGIILEDEDD